jgi:hypothetical protein
MGLCNLRLYNSGIINYVCIRYGAIMMMILRLVSGCSGFLPHPRARKQGPEH